MCLRGWIASALVFGVTLAVPKNNFALEKGQMIYATGRSSDGNYTGGYGNGRFWVGMTKQERILYLVALEDGVQYLGTELYPRLDEKPLGILNNNMAENTVPGVRMSEIAEKVDKFYSETVNVRIAIVYARDYVFKGLRGASKKEMEDYESFLRGFWNDDKRFGRLEGQPR